MCVTRFSLIPAKVLAVLILALVCVNVSLAEKVNADAAYRIANEFFSGPASRSVGKLSLAYTCPEDAAYYVFNAEAADGGFVVVAGDDAVTPILGYSDVATFDPTNIPPALQWKLDSYKAEIATAASKGIKVVASRSASPDKAPIDPLITTQWGQSAPYNNLCPYDEGGRSLTGCVATALAQIVNYHKWPNRGNSSFSYKWKNEELSFDYSTTNFDWDNMRDKYDGVVFSDQEAHAVAELMYACGVGAEMCYSSCSSGSSESHAKRFLVENLNYSPEIAVRYIGNYSNDEWNNLLYKELRNCRPMLCAGGGHAYICDGYDGDGYFHYNWGWDGFADGFFLPSLLNPIDDSAYQKDQTILIGIEPNWSGEVYHVPDLICKDEFKVDKFGRSLIKVWNYSKYVFNGRVGAKIVSETGDSDVYHTFDWDINLEGVEMIGIFASTCGDHQNIQLPIDIGLASGQYKLYLSYHGEDNIWRDLRCFTGCQDHILLEVTKDNEYIYSNPPLPNEPVYEIKVSDISFNDLPDRKHTVFPDEQIDVIATYLNCLGNVCRPNISLVFTSNGEDYLTYQSSITIEGPIELRYTFGLGRTFDVGDYELDFYDEYGRRLNDETVCFSVIPRPDDSGIEAPEVDGWDADAPVEYYDLQGRKVANPTTGFYIARQGSLTRKVFIR